MATTSNAAMRKKTPFHVWIILGRDTSIAAIRNIISPRPGPRHASHHQESAPALDAPDWGYEAAEIVTKYK